MTGLGSDYPLPQSTLATLPNKARSASCPTTNVQLITSKKSTMLELFLALLFAAASPNTGGETGPIPPNPPPPGQ